MSNRIFFTIVLLSLVSVLSAAQTIFPLDITRPEVGKPLPDFTLNNVTHFKKTKVSLSDFKGKWLFLDFWFTGCSACIHSFRKVNAFHKEFKNELNWIMIGLNDTKHNKGIQELYEKLRIKQNLEMPVAYDSILSKKWDIHSMPHIIIIDPSGMVRFISGGRDITAEKIKGLLAGSNVSFYPKDIARPGFEPEKISNVDSTKGIDNNLLYRSVLTRWNGEKQGLIDIDRWITWPEEYLRKGYSLAMAPLYMLYNYAYIGNSDWDFIDTSYCDKFYPKPILEVRDSSLFQYDFTVDQGRGTYNYSLTIPPQEVSKESIMTQIQKDLKRVFKYDVVVETRNMAVWKLVAKPGAADKLRTKGGERYDSPGSHIAGYTMRNWPPEYLIGSLSFYLKERYNGEVFIDETGVTDYIDISLNADMTDLEDIRKELKKQGLDLVKGTKEMKVIVIKDSKGIVKSVKH
jgi:thiol-disulfide isomerase/thioredoxin